MRNVPANMFASVSTPADRIAELSLFVLVVTGAIFVVVFSLTVIAAIRFRRRADDDGREPPQVYGSNQLEIAWTVIPILIVLVLALTTARVIQSVQGVRRPANAIDVTVIGHQWWWEFRYPALGIVTANELHVPVSEVGAPTATWLTLLSADVAHSFWVPRLAGKTDLIPNRVNHMWLAPTVPGIYVGQCAEYCGTQHA
jgi:cytochrome c oxidase subunit 2